MNIGGPPTAKDFGGAGDLLLDLEEDFPAFDGDGGDLLLDLEEDFPAFDGDAGDGLLALYGDFPAFGDDLLFFVFFLVPDVFPFFVFRGALVTLPLELDTVNGVVVVFLVMSNKLLSNKIGIPDEGLRSGGTGEEGCTFCVCQDIGACGEGLGACGKSIGVRDEGFGTDGEGIIGFATCMMVGVDCPQAVIEFGSIHKRHMK
jgi:hypothetical protein